RRGSGRIHSSHGPIRSAGRRRAAKDRADGAPDQPALTALAGAELPGALMLSFRILNLWSPASCLYCLSLDTARDETQDMTSQLASTRSRTRSRQDGTTLDLDRYVPAFITFIANKLSNSATVRYQRNFGVNVTEWRIMSLLAIEPGIPASRIC